MRCVVRGAPPPNAHLRPEAAGAGRGFPNCVPTSKSGPTRGRVLLPYALAEDGAPSVPPGQQPPSGPLGPPLPPEAPLPCVQSRLGARNLFSFGWLSSRSSGTMNSTHLVEFRVAGRVAIPQSGHKMAPRRSLCPKPQVQPGTPDGGCGCVGPPRRGPGECGPQSALSGWGLGWELGGRFRQGPATGLQAEGN